MKNWLLICLALLATGCATPMPEIRTRTPAGAEDAVLYQTSNGFTMDERYFVFGRRHDTARQGNKMATGRFQMFRRDMLSGEETRLTAEGTRSTYLGGVVGGNSLFFATLGRDGGVYELDVPSASAPQRIWDFPAPMRGKSQYKIYPLSASRDGNTVLVAMQDEMPVDRGEKLNVWHDAFMQSGAHAYLYLGQRTASGWDFKKIYEQTDISKGWIGHAQLNPQTGRDVYYELDGNCKKVEQRGWLLDIATGTHSKVYPEASVDVCTSHGQYLRDGLILVQKYNQLNYPTRSDAVLVDTHTGEIRQFEVGPHMHLQAFERQGDLFVFGDGWTQDPTVRRRIFRKGREIGDRLVAARGRNTAWEEYHQHARLSPSGQWLVFGSSEGLGNGSVVLIRDPLRMQ
jgi:hypothetical protein